MPLDQTKARLGRLPKAGKELWIEIYEKDYIRKGDKTRASKIAWSVVGKKYKKDTESGKWMKRKGLKKKSVKRKTAKKGLRKRKVIRRNPLELDEGLVISSELFNIYFNKFSDPPGLKDWYKEIRKNLLKTIIAILSLEQGELAAKYVARQAISNEEYSVKDLEYYLEEWDDKVY